MKKNLFMVAAVALMALVSCNKEVTPSEEIAPVGETVTFTAYADGADVTKAQLNKDQQSEWVSGDAITIHNGTSGYEFVTTEAGAKADFSYTGNDFSGEKFIAVYPAGEYTADVEAKTVTANIPTFQAAVAGSFNTSSALAVAYSEDMSLKFKNATALIKFTIKGSNIKAIEFYGNGSEPITGPVLVSMNDDKTVKSVEVLETEMEVDGTPFSGKPSWVKIYSVDEANGWCFADGATYYAAIAPQDFATGVSVNYILSDDTKVEGAKKTEKPVSLPASTILNIGVLEYDANIVDPSAFGVAGSFQTPTTWDAANSVAMEYVSDGWIVAKNVELYKTDEFKFVKDNSWTVSYGTSAVTVLENNVETAVVTEGSQNMKVSKNGKYNLYLNPNTKKVKVECVEEYTDLKVNITIDNKANWSPLYITLKNGNEVVVDNEVVTDNKYQISGDYIGTTLTCTLSNGSKTSEVMNVAITKTGATVTLEETIIKLKIQLNTSNSKQWWGNTMKIHVWNTGTSFDTSWPGNTMTSEGNYTWSIIVPSELVGKTINFLVHNGNGWQSKDATVTIKAEGNTVTGSSIGVN
jgi:hypothetical protein